MDLETLKQRAKAFDYLFDAVVVTDLKGIITDWNKGSENLYGYSRDEVVGQPVNILHVPEDTAEITAQVLAAVEEHGQWTGEIKMLHKDGFVGWIESMCVPIFDENSEMVGALGINRDITSRKQEAERLAYLAHYDQLTGIPNRHLLFSRLNHIISQCEREQKGFAVLYIDLDKFKDINDTKGHQIGDRVLVEAALRLQNSIRNSDTVARVGGDEFVLILENIESENRALEMVKTIAKTFNKNFAIDNDEIKLSCSIGLAVYPNDGVTTETLFNVADKAMYKSKKRSLTLAKNY